MIRVKSQDTSCDHFSSLKFYYLLFTIFAVTTPMISVQPMSLAVLPGDNATFTVAASGGGTLTYRWRFLPSDDDPFDLAGATDATLTITGVTAADVGDYSVTVFNQAGSVVSQPASLSFSESNCACS